jgi:hypothetical protein
MASSMFSAAAPVLSDSPTLEERRAMIIWLQPPCYFPAEMTQSEHENALGRQSKLVKPFRTTDNQGVHRDHGKGRRPGPALKCKLGIA